MGYYTDFRLSVVGSGPVYDKLMSQKNNVIISRGNYDFPLSRWIDKDYSDNLKWYEWKEDMKQLSSEWPNVLFILEGDGEESGDMWKAWFRNGRSYKLEAKIVFETAKVDLDTLLPIDYDVEERLAKQYKEEIQARIKELSDELENLNTRLVDKPKGK